MRKYTKKVDIIFAAVIVLLLFYLAFVPMQPGEYAVALGTSLLALFTFIATIQNREDSTTNRRISHITSQLEELYGPILEMKEDFMHAPLEKFRIKSYLASKEVRKKLEELSSLYEDWSTAAAQDRTWGTRTASIQDATQEAYDRETKELANKERQSRDKVERCTRELVELVRIESDHLYEELQDITS
jgi:hypothetical protein